MQHVALIAAVLTASTCLVSALRPLTPKERLVHDLLKNYQPAVDPGPTTLFYSVAFSCARYDQATGNVVSNVWETHIWQDARLSWHPNEYVNVKRIRVPAKLIWTPDTRLFNSSTSFVERDDVNVVIESNGNVLWIPRATYRSLCLGDEDEAICSWRIGSWTYDEADITLRLFGSGPIDLTNYSAACPSIITDVSGSVVSHKYPDVEGLYPSLDITFTVKPR